MVQWLNDNSARSYPFVDTGDSSMLFSGGGEKQLPTEAVVEMFVIIGPDIEFDYATHRVYLREVRRTGDQFDFKFRCTAPELSGYELRFCRHVDDKEYALTEASFQAVELTGLSLTQDCSGLVGYGWLTTGRLDSLAELLAPGDFLLRADGEIYLEPAQIQQMRRTLVRSINLANKDRTRVAKPELCSSDTATPEKNIITNTTCLQGHIKLKPGYNCVIQQNDNENSILIGAGVGEGAGEPCEEVPIYEGEQPPQGSTLLTGGPACNEVLKTINGVGGPHIELIPGLGVNIKPSPDSENTIVVDVNLHGLALCFGSELSDSP